jgi:hypothetical protein
VCAILKHAEIAAARSFGNEDRYIARKCVDAPLKATWGAFKKSNRGCLVRVGKRLEMVAFGNKNGRIGDGREHRIRRRCEIVKPFRNVVGDIAQLERAARCDCEYVIPEGGSGNGQKLTIEAESMCSCL